MTSKFWPKRGRSEPNRDNLERTRSGGEIDVDSSDREERSTNVSALSRPRNCDNVEAGVGMQGDSIIQFEGVLQRFSYNELSEATKGFSKESELGQGGFGVVYKAELKSGIQVAIKRMDPKVTYTQGIKAFKSEVEIVSRVNHRNLIKLRGYCEDENNAEYMVVYDYMPNGSLDDALFDPKGTNFLSWPQKFKILTDIADGLGYLHQGLNQPVIHRDIKCSNILLDKELNAKLGDFGIARMVAHQGRAATTHMAGTPGYMAPEVFSDLRFTDKADVYAFGVVVFEVACGRRVLPKPSSNDMHLVDWVRLAHDKKNVLSTVDKRHSAVDNKHMKMVLKVGLLCTEKNPLDRPSMKRIVQILAGDNPTSKPRLDPSAMMKHLFYKKVPIWVSRVPHTVSVESQVQSSATGTPGLPSRSPQTASLLESHVRSSATGTPGLPSRSPQTASVLESQVRPSASGSAVSPRLASPSAQLNGIVTSAVSTDSELRRRKSVGMESRELAQLENEDKEKRKLSVESPTTSASSGTSPSSGVRRVQGFACKWLVKIRVAAGIGLLYLERNYLLAVNSLQGTWLEPLAQLTQRIGTLGRLFLFSIFALVVYLFIRFYFYIALFFSLVYFSYHVLNFTLFLGFGSSEESKDVFGVLDEQ